MNFQEIARAQQSLQDRATAIWALIYKASRTWRRNRVFGTRNVIGVTFESDRVVIHTEVDSVGSTLDPRKYNFPMGWLDLTDEEISAEIALIQTTEQVLVRQAFLRESDLIIKANQLDSKLSRLNDECCEKRKIRELAQTHQQFYKKVLDELTEGRISRDAVSWAESKVESAGKQAWEAGQAEMLLDAEAKLVREEYLNARFAHLDGEAKAPKAPKPDARFGLGLVFTLAVEGGFEPQPGEADHDNGGELY